MTPTLHIGDCRDVLRTLQDESVHCCVTSPPYWGLRDYGTAEWKGGDAGCDHRSPTMREGRNENRAKLAGSSATNAAQLILAAHSKCGKCGAIRIDAQIGLEPTPEEYTAKLVEVFREVRRVLRSDGTLWLNLGDSYNGAGLSGGTAPAIPGTFSFRGAIGKGRINAGLKPKDLVGIPWRVAFALQTDGWYLRSDIIWHKPNPMPESVTDRPTKAHEYMFLLSKSEQYYYDAEAIAEPCTADSYRGSSFTRGKTFTAQNQLKPVGAGERIDQTSRNKRSVWTIATQPYPEAHFATFPADLVRPCILAGCPIGGRVLDPFAGSGTVLEVARALQCESVGIDLNPEYGQLSEKRLAQGFMEFSAEDAPLQIPGQVADEG